MAVWDWAQLAALGVMLCVFVWQVFRHGQLQWLWFSVALWLVLGWFSGSLMPRVLGITHLPNFFILHTYLFAGSVFFWLNNIQRLPEKNKYWHSRSGAVLLTLFCTSSLVIHLAFALFAVLITWVYPSGLSPYAAAFLWQLYFTEPLNILMMHAFLMIVFYLNRRIQGLRGDEFGLPQLELGWLLMLLWIAAALYQKAQLLLHR